MTRSAALAVATSMAALCMVSLVGCTSTAVTTATSPTATVAPGGGSPTTADTLGTAAPTSTSAIPDGVYRTRITGSDLTRLAIEDVGNAGTWTLTISKGSYFLRCAPTTTSGTDCGQDNVPKDTLVEVGWVRGTGSTVWFVHDPVRTQTMTGCNHECPMGGYRMTWKSGPKMLTFSHYVGIGDEAGPVLANWVAQPWTRIS